MNRATLWQWIHLAISTVMVVLYVVGTLLSVDRNGPFYTQPIWWLGGIFIGALFWGDLAVVCWRKRGRS